MGFPCGSASKESNSNVGDLGSILGLGKSPGEGQGYPLQYSGLENPMDCIGHGVANSRTRQSDFHFHGSPPPPTPPPVCSPEEPRRKGAGRQGVTRRLGSGPRLLGHLTRGSSGGPRPQPTHTAAGDGVEPVSNFLCPGTLLRVGAGWGTA